MKKHKKWAALQEKTFHLLDWNEHSNPTNLRLKIVLAAVTVLAVIIVVVDSFSGLPMWWSILSLLLNILITALFSVEYILRFWVAPLQYTGLPPWRARLRYLRKPASIIDFVAVLPFYLMVLTDLDVTSLRTLWILRLFVLLKFNRYFHTLDSILLVIKRKRLELITSLLAVASLMLISSALIYTIESRVQPEKFRNILSGFWWAISTLLTIGYGDIYPITGMGRLLASVVAILGVGLIAVPTGIISAGYVEEMQSNHEKNKERRQTMRSSIMGASGKGTPAKNSLPPKPKTRQGTGKTANDEKTDAVMAPERKTYKNRTPVEDVLRKRRYKRK